MKSKYVSLLKRIVETPSPTGSEVAVASIVRERLAPIADEIKTDTMGSVHTSYYGSIHHREEGDGSTAAGGIYQGGADVESAPLTLMLAAHMDEIGLMVTYISDEGFLSIAALGGVDAAILPGMRVNVHTESGVLRGVVGRKPIHLIDADDRKTVTPLDKLVIDLGMPPKKVKKKVRVGDAITFAVGFERFGQDMAVSRAFDDKVGVFIACRVMENLADNLFYRGNFVAAITVQEEIGTRGAMTSAHSVSPDVALAFDVTHATDYPGIDKSKYGNIVCGAGPVIARGPNINPAVFDRLVKAAEDEGIDYQLEAEPSVTGTDARAIQVTRGGIPTGLISIPLRYMHTPTEVISLHDVECAVRLITRFALDLNEVKSFVPGYAERYIARANREDLEFARSQRREGAVEAVEEVGGEAADAEDSEESAEITPEESPFGRQHDSLSAEFNKLDLDQVTIAEKGAQGEEVQTQGDNDAAAETVSATGGKDADAQDPALPAQQPQLQGQGQQQGQPYAQQSGYGMPGNFSQQMPYAQSQPSYQGGYNAPAYSHQPRSGADVQAAQATSRPSDAYRQQMAYHHRYNPDLMAVPIVTIDSDDEEDDE